MKLSQPQLVFIEANAHIFINAESEGTVIEVDIFNLERYTENLMHMDADEVFTLFFDANLRHVATYDQELGTLTIVNNRAYSQAVEYEDTAEFTSDWETVVSIMNKRKMEMWLGSELNAAVTAQYKTAVAALNEIDKIFDGEV